MQKTAARHPAASASPPGSGGLAFSRRIRSAVLGSITLSLAAIGAPSPALALPGFIAGKGDTPRISNSTQVVLLQKGDQTVVTVWADYEGPLDHFALVLPVPSDVELADV